MTPPKPMPRFRAALKSLAQGLLLACAVSIVPPASAAPDEELLGRAQGYPVGTATNWLSEPGVRVGSFTHQAEIAELMGWKVRTLSPGSRTMPLPHAARTPPYRWNIDALRNLTVDDYLARQRIMGLIVIKDGVVQLERYQYGRGAGDRFVSHSMAKSLVSLAVGLALQERRLHSLDDPAQRYDAALDDTLYGATSLRDLLRMGSGARFEERYDGRDDLEQFGLLVARQGIELAARSVSERAAPAGQRFNYASPETLMLAAAVTNAVGMNLSAYLEARLWQPMGAESTAQWLTDRTGLELASGNFNATLRDYARLGWLLANDGLRPDTGEQILPRDYLLEATDATRLSPPFAPKQATRYLGYGYQFWLYPGRVRRFAMLGVYGQMIVVDPDLKLVMVQTAANATPKPEATTLAREADAFWRGLVDYYGGRW